MASATSIKFASQLLMLGNGAGPEVFAAPCGVEELTMTVNIESENTAIPDCDSPDFPAWLVTDIVSKQIVLSGSGLLDPTAMKTWQAWWYDDEGAEKNIRWFRDLSAANGGGYFQGPAVLTAYEEGSPIRHRWTNSFTVTFNGKPTWTPAS